MPTFRTGFPEVGVENSAKACHTSGMEFTPTAEQDAIIAAARTGENVVVTAVAGSGKTSTLKLIAADRPATSFLMLAFGKDIQLSFEAANLPNVEARTAHSLAWHHCTAHHPHIMRRQGKMGKGYDCPIKPWHMPSHLGLPAARTFEADGEPRVITGKSLLSMVNASVTRFCRTADEQITAFHVVREFENSADQAIFAKFLLPFVQKVWGDLTSPTGILSTTGDHYLKQWSLDCPQLPFDCILFDEAQDADPAIAHVVEAQRRQVIMVGDASQAIYGWRGAVDALSRFTASHRLSLTQSFRFGPAIAEFANRFLNALEAEVRVVGFEQVASAITTGLDADAILCRSNAGVIEYAIEMLGAGKRVAIAGGTDDLKSFIRAAKKLMDIEATGKGFCGHAELGAFKSWTDAVEHAGTEEGSDIRIKVNLIQQYGADFLIDLLDKLVDVKKADPADYDVVISTAHKAKGLEWDSVMIGSDFKLPKVEGELPSAADLMLMYVAVTRAKLNLNPGILGMLAL
jgi:hypothetical protein